MCLRWLGLLTVSHRWRARAVREEDTTLRRLGDRQVIGEIVWLSAAIENWGLRCFGLFAPTMTCARLGSGA